MAAPTPDQFRRAMARVPTPVTIVTAPGRRPDSASQAGFPAEDPGAARAAQEGVGAEAAREDEGAEAARGTEGGEGGWGRGEGGPGSGEGGPGGGAEEPGGGAQASATGGDAGGAAVPPAGATANAVASLSLEPPLMLVCLDRGSRTLRAVRESGVFAVNVLGAGSEEHARRFASKAPHAEKWEGVAWTEHSGAPVLDEAIVWVVCELRDLLDGGDHVIVTGHVRDLGTREGAALAFHAGTYRPVP